MTVAIMTILVLATLGAVVLMLALNQSRLPRSAVEGRTRAFYRAQAGLVHAQEAIRLGSCPACRANICSFCDASCASYNAVCPYESAAYDPAVYYLDMETGTTAGFYSPGVSDAQVNIGTANASGIRSIVSLGYEQ